MTSCSQGRVTTAKDFATMPGTILDQFYIYFFKIKKNVSFPELLIVEVTPRKAIDAI